MPDLECKIFSLYLVYQLVMKLREAIKNCAKPLKQYVFSENFINNPLNVFSMAAGAINNRIR